MENLPNEVLAIVAGNIEPAAERRDRPDGSLKISRVSEDMLNLSHTSPRLHGVVELVIYQAVTLGNLKSTLAFLRTMLYRPDLAARVKKIHIRGETCTNQDLRALRREYSKTFATCVHMIENHLSKDTRKANENAEWIRQVKNGSWSSLVGMLLTILPRLEALELGPYGSEIYRTYDSNDHPQVQFDVFPTIFRLDSPAQRSTVADFGLVKSLTKVYLEGYYDITQTLVDMRHFGQLAHVEKITLKGQWMVGRYPHNVSLCLTRKLIIEVGWHYESWILHLLLAEFPFLEQFSFKISSDYPGRQENDQNTKPINSIVRNLISKNAKTLRKLTLKLTFWLDLYEMEDGFKELSVESMSSLSSLTTLDVPAFDIWMWHAYIQTERKTIADSFYLDLPVLGWNNIENVLTPLTNILPRSIESITLRHASRLTVFHVYALFRSYGFKEKFPVLKNIDIEFLADYSEATCFFPGSREGANLKQDTKQLVELGKDHGVAVVCTIQEEPWLMA